MTSFTHTKALDNSVRPWRVAATSLLVLFTLIAKVQGQDFTYATNNGTLTITGYTGTNDVVAIPDTTNGLPVTSIGGSAFWNNTNLTSVIMPNNVTNIGDYAFNGCLSLTNVTIGNGVTNIGDNAFDGCTSLTSITIPNSVTNIGEGAFNSCSSLSSVTIPNSVTTIGGLAFIFCTSLTSVTIPGSVTNIGLSAFYGCTNLTAITVDTGNSVYSDMDGVLFNKSLTTLVQYPGGIAGSYVIPNGATSIGDDAFDVCSSLTSVTIPNSVTNIGLSAFWFCTSLTSVIIPNNVTSIGGSAFGGCYSLTGVYFKGNAPSLSTYYPFDGDTNTTVYYLPGTTGWGTTFGGRPTRMLWRPQVQTSDASFGVRTNQFGFNINGASGMTVVVEACTNIANPIWSPVGTNTLTSDSSYFSDPGWSNHPVRFYRIRWP